LFRQTNRFTPFCLSKQTGLHHFVCIAQYFVCSRLPNFDPVSTKCSPTKSLGYSTQSTWPTAVTNIAADSNNHLLRCTLRRTKTNTKTVFVRFLSTAKRLTTRRRTPSCIFKLSRRPIKVYSCPRPPHKDMWKSRHMAPFILNLDIRCKQVVSSMLRPP
jgi:hypothetical protein